jgi:hypothetical protein
MPALGRGSGFVREDYPVLVEGAGWDVKEPTGLRGLTYDGEILYSASISGKKSSPIALSSHDENNWRRK